MNSPIGLCVILEGVPEHILKGIKEDIEDVQVSYNVTADTTIRADIGRICLDLENDAHSIAVALMNSIDLLDDIGLSPYVIEIGVMKWTNI